MALCTPSDGADMDRFVRLVPDEVAALRELKGSGCVIEAWSRGRPGAVLILAVDDIDSARRVVEQLPLARAGLLTSELIPLHDIEL